MYPGHSKIIPAPLPFMFEASSIGSVNYGGVSSSIRELNSATKSDIDWDLMLPLGTYWISVFESSTS